MDALCTSGGLTTAPGRCSAGDLVARAATGKGKVLGGLRTVRTAAEEYSGSRIGDALSPARIAMTLAQADRGYTANYHDLLNECRQKDGELQSMLSTREEALVARGWTIAPVVEPGKKEAGKRAKRNADYCRWALENILGFNGALSHLQDARYKGFSICETEWVKHPRTGDVVPHRLHVVPGRDWYVTPDGRTEYVRPGFANREDVMAETPWRFVRHAPRTNGDILRREGLGRCLVWFSAFGTWSMRDWLLFAELFGKPWRVAEYDQTTMQDGLEERLQAVLDSMTANTYAIVPSGVKLRVEWPASPGGQTTAPQAGILAQCKNVKALAILGQLATTGDVSGGLGGKGDERHEVRKDLECADDKALSETIRWQLLAPLLWLKYGTQEIPPAFGFNTDDAIDVEKFLKSAAAARALGLELSKAQLYATSGFDQPRNDEDRLGGPVEGEGEKPGAKPGEKPATDKPAAEGDGEDMAADPADEEAADD